MAGKRGARTSQARGGGGGLGLEGRRPMDFSGILSWLFSSREGVLVLLGVILVGFLIAAIILERKTRKDYDQYDDEDDDESGWSFFDDDNK